ncbi:MAG: 2,3-bisphosphoglycerate-independent phosphoglycerate mutase [Patescibacteria group bacterium]|jgi:2,3-bisphosphoglycerate-independent phosphoglycerate mutase
MNPYLLVIMDGWGIAPENKGNAVALANTPNYKKLRAEYSYTELVASGKQVGLPEGQDGNSEAGHMNIGAGRVVIQDAVHINHRIYDGTFFKNAALIDAINHVKKYGSRMHLMGLLTEDMSAHACPDHLYALLELMKQKEITSIYLHLFTDGRDAPQHGAINFLKNLRKYFQNGEIIATITGRYYAMERNKRWDVTEKVYNLLTLGEAEHQAPTATDAVLQAYNRNETDEFIKPTLIDKNGLIKDGDSVIFFNLRSDRTRQLSKAFVQPEFNKKNPKSFTRKKIIKHLKFVAMTDFGPDLDSIVSAFPSADVPETLPIMLMEKKQMYIAESEKYAHVTYFFNGGYADPVSGEERIKIPSPDVFSYDEKPEMSASQITDKVLKELKDNKYDFYCINYANPDMVGHTGNLQATIKACECVDEQLGRLWAEVSKKKGTMIITADHGNAEELLNLKTGEIDTEHSTNPVPLIITKKGLKLKKNGSLGNIAPTILKLMNLPAQKLMVAKPLC